MIPLVLIPVHFVEDCGDSYISCYFCFQKYVKTDYSNHGKCLTFMM